MKKLLMVCVLCSLMLTSALARDYDNRRFVVAGQGGVFIPTEDEFLGADTELSAYGIIDGQYFFNDYVGVGMYLMGAGYGIDEDELGPNFDEAYVTSGIAGVSVIARLPLTKMDFYALAGVGIAYNEYETEEKSGGVTTKKSQDDTNISYRAEIGMRYYVWRTLSVGGAVGYLGNEMEVKDSGVKHTEKLNGIYTGISAAWSF